MCPRCGYPKGKVFDTKATSGAVFRRKACNACYCEYSTREVVDPAADALLKEYRALITSEWRNKQKK